MGVVTTHGGAPAPRLAGAPREPWGARARGAGAPSLLATLGEAAAVGGQRKTIPGYSWILLDRLQKGQARLNSSALGALLTAHGRGERKGGIAKDRIENQLTQLIFLPPLRPRSVPPSPLPPPP
eukprot:5804160-Pyramimonas_sp.AAC.1